MIWTGKRGQGRLYFTKSLLPVKRYSFPWKTFLQRFLGEPFPPIPNHDKKISVFHFRIFLILGESDVSLVFRSACVVVMDVQLCVEAYCRVAGGWRDVEVH